MQIVFRVDASATIGTGHVMRCLTLANALKVQGAACTFISRHLPDYLQRFIESNAHNLIVVGDHATTGQTDDLAHAHFLGTSQAQDAEETKVILNELKPDWLVIDHYGIDQRWESALRPLNCRILVIDDLADRKHNCDLLVDQNLYLDGATRYNQLIPAGTETLLGPKYAILRPEFALARRQAKVRQGTIHNIFIFFGGMDLANFTLPVLAALTALRLEKIQINVVIGQLHPAREAIESLCRKHGYFCHVQTQKMAELILEADLAIGAGGSTSWERCCLGVPSLAFIAAPNQHALTLDADHSGLLKAASCDINDARSLQNEIKSFLSADEARKKMSQACLATIDALGANRIIDKMLAPPLQLRRAKASDSRLLFEWRNHPSIRRVSINSELIPWESHQQWLSNSLENDARELYLAEAVELPVGVIRFDLNHLAATAEVSLYLSPEQVGKGLGTQLLLAGERELLQTHPEINCLVATVVEDNEASHRLFSRCGYQFVDYKYTKTIQA